MAKIKRLKDKQRSAKYYTEYKRWSKTDFTKLGGELRKGKQFLLHMWHPSCQSCYKPGDKTWTRKGPDYNICGHLWYIYSVTVSSSWWIHHEFNLTHMNLWSSSFLVSSNPLTEIPIGTTRSEISTQLRDIYQYTRVVWMLLYLNGKFTMGKLKSSLLS